MALLASLVAVGALVNSLFYRLPRAKKSLITAILSLGLCDLFLTLLSLPLFSVGFFLCATTAICVGILGANGVRINQSQLLLPTYTFGLCLHFAAFFGFAYIHHLRPEIGFISTSAVVALAFAFYSLNSRHLDSWLSENETQVPQSVRAFNRVVVTTLLFIVLIAFACFMFFVNLGWIERLLFNTLQHLLVQPQQPSSLPSTPHPTLKHDVSPKLPPPSNMPALWQHVIMIVIGALFLAICIFGLLRGMKALWAWYQTHRDPVLEWVPYIDEEESLAGETHHLQRFPWVRPRKREVAWSELSSPEEKVRYLYRHLIQSSRKKGYPWTSADTARETTEAIYDWLHQPLGNPSSQTAVVDGGKSNSVSVTQVYQRLEELYDTARYGEGAVSETDVSDLRDALKKI